jgi:hypothetical protein
VNPSAAYPKPMQMPITSPPRWPDTSTCGFESKNDKKAVGTIRMKITILSYI